MTSIRFATNGDFAMLEDIENEADRLFIERFHPDSWDRAISGFTRATQPGFILVAAESDGGYPIGFAHVLDLDGDAHLEQLAVRPRSGRRGHGSALVREVLSEAGRRGHPRVTLRTYADVPWNAPWYAALGFVESEPDTAALLRLLDLQHALALERYGRRIQMTASTEIHRGAET